jgi:tRNA A-37 threonylcarbamoyl transferase component Bud32
VDSAQLDRALRDLPTSGKLVKSRPYRQVWRFEFAGKPYYLKFYPRRGGAMKRFLRGSPAMREFTNLQALQRAKIPSPRAVAHLSGFQISGEKGDAVILEAIEPSVPLDRYLNDFLLRGERPPEHRRLVAQIIEIVQRLGQAKLGHNDLHLGNFLLHDGKLYLLDGYAIRPGGMRFSDIMLLGHSVSRFATTSDLLRGWKAFSGGALPRRNPLRRVQWRKLVSFSRGDNRYFGKLDDGTWTGHFFRHAKFPRRWAPVSRIDVADDDWRREWANLVARINADTLEVIKRSRSGDVLAGEIVLAGKPVSVIVKRSRRRHWYRYINELWRGARSPRAWTKSWSVIARDIPTAWPLLMMERKTLGYPWDGVIVFERVRGTQLSDIDLDALSPDARRNLFHRLGRTLRLLEAAGLRQYDSKMANWMIVDDPVTGPTPVVIDVDGIRKFTAPLYPIQRILRSMRDHAQYTPADSRELCLGYSPYAHLVQEQAEDKPED